METARPAPSERRKGIASILLATLFWSFPTLAIEFLTKYTDIYTQNFIRFLSATVFLWAVCLVRSRREVLAGARILLRVLPAVGALFAYQYLHVRALYLQELFPGLDCLVIKSSVLFTAVLSFIFFADERSVIRDWRFIVGISLSLLGLVGFLSGRIIADIQRVAGSADALTWGILLVLVSAFFWSLYAVLVKLLVRRGSLLVSYTYVCTLMTVAFGVLTFTSGNPGDLIPGGGFGGWPLAVAVGSGVVCVGAAHLFYYRGIRSLGTTVCSTVLLSTVFLTPLLSVFFFGERLSPWHALSGGVLVAGAAFTLQARPDKVSDKVSGTL